LEFEQPTSKLVEDTLNPITLLVEKLGRIIVAEEQEGSL
jgi:hypothetical protein